THVPGTMDGVVRETLAGPLGRGAALCYWPCFARERVAAEDEAAPRVVVCGVESNAVAGRVRPFLAPQGCDLRVMSFVEAELAKQAANAWNATKISYFTALGDWADALGGRGQAVADVVAAAAEGSWNPTYGTRVGTAYGGACLPKDLDALLAVAEARELPHAGLLRAVRAVNESPLRTGRPD